MKYLAINRNYKKAEDINGDFWMDSGSKPEGSIGQIGDNKFLGKYLSEKRINIFLAIIFVGILIIFSRIFYLQVVQGDYYSKMAEINRTRESPLIASRGLIFDRNNKPLVRNIPILDASILPKD
jgi:cell division protein FtsI/penicillin-binding protein 2